MEQPTKQQQRELVRWSEILRRRERGELSISDLAKLYDVTKAQIYALLKRARFARERGWIDGK